MDCNMPVMDGFQSTKLIRELEDTNKTCAFDRIKIVALTAYSNDAFAKKCYEAGMDNFITKPVNILDLKAILSQF